MSAHVIQTASTWNKLALEALAPGESFAQESSALRGPACGWLCDPMSGRTPSFL